MNLVVQQKHIPYKYRLLVTYPVESAPRFPSSSSLPPRNPSQSPAMPTVTLPSPIRGRVLVAIVSTSSPNLLDVPTLKHQLETRLANVEFQTTPTAETRGLVYLPSMTEGDAHLVLARILAKFPAIEWVQLPMSGVDEYRDLIKAEAKSKCRRIWCSGKGAASHLVAEHALTLTLSLLRHIPERCTSTTWGHKLGTSLFLQEVLILGYGSVSRSLISLLAPFGCRTSVVRLTSSCPVSDDNTTIYPSRSLPSLLPHADIVILALALTPETHGSFSTPQLGSMKPGSVLVNVSRGQIVNTDALVQAIREGNLAGVGLDVVDPEPLPDEHELWRLVAEAKRGKTKTQVILTPHSAVTPRLLRPYIVRRVERNVEAFVRGEELEGVVDPEKGY
ncbi:hypothetical protein ACQY0O_005235 [Thecaphora frezii]